MPCRVSYSTAVGITISAGAHPNLNLGEIGNLSIDASVAWSQTNTTGYTSGENRAKGDPPYVRGVTAQPALIDIAGVATGYHTGDSCALKGQKEKEKEKEKEDKYAFTAPILQANSANVTPLPACIAHNSPNRNTQPGLPLCP